ncbi:type IV secretion protein VblB3 [Bartonella australis AUST/NH1]|uniref:Type IV secretion protein VblB3 n=1 Tax=Bartonella australis (strain Aust/NH1) TaxID=1094489 RepID=M1P500_BARAA|nr:type IV secretion system protein VirB3 [Bartonella australis]AGF74925.1 type IV secretion protein VblB3 [Bartonella australis AUST/NH1]
MKKRDQLTEDTLFLACTRPAMIAGVTVEAMGLNVIATSIIFIMSSNIFLISFGVVTHFIMKEITKNDHNKFRILMVWLNTRGRSKNSNRWGGASVAPLRLIRNYKDMK